MRTAEQIIVYCVRQMHQYRNKKKMNSGDQEYNNCCDSIIEELEEIIAFILGDSNEN